MFAGCSSLEKAPSQLLPTKISNNLCYSHMFYKCPKLKTAPDIHVSTFGKTNALQYMFHTSSVNKIRVWFKLWKNSDGTGFSNSWVYDVADQGVFYCPPELERKWDSRYNGYYTPKNVDYKWTIYSYDITFVPVGGSWADGTTENKRFTWETDTTDVYSFLAAQVDEKSVSLIEGYYLNNVLSDATTESAIKNDLHIQQTTETKYIYVKLKSTTPQEYQITFVGEDGTVLDEQTVEAGTTPTYKGETPTKEKDVQYTYTFAGWTPALYAADNDQTYTATFTPKSRLYTITFKYNSDSTLQSGAVAYGTTPTYILELPTKEADVQYTYTFKGWTPEIVSVTGNATYTATFNETKRQYTLTWDFAGGVTATAEGNYTHDSIEWGTTIIAPADPTKSDYIFAGWSNGSEVVTPASVMPTQNLTYTATWTPSRVVIDGDSGLEDVADNVDVIILQGATLTANADKTLGHIIVNPGGKLVIPAGVSITAIDLTMRGGYKDYDDIPRGDDNIIRVPQADIRGGLLPTEGDKINIVYDYNIDQTKFNDIALPFESDFDSIIGPDGCSLAANIYDGESRALGKSSCWISYWKNRETFPIEVGIGYLEKIKKVDGILRHPMTADLQYGSWGERSVNVTAHGFTNGKKNAGLSSSYVGWNFVANPYMADFDGTKGASLNLNGRAVRYVSTYDYENNKYSQQALSASVLPPFTGFFVQVNNSTNLLFIPQGGASLAPMRVEDIVLPAETELVLTITKDAEKDNTVILLGNDFSRTDTEEFFCDQSKLTDGTDIKFYSIESGETLFANAMTYKEAETPIALGVRIAVAGSYTFSCPRAMEYDYVATCVLHDKVAGTYNDLATNDYSVSLEAGTYTDRFEITITMVEETPTDMDNISTYEKPEKFIENGVLYIRRGNKLYDSNGKMLSKDIKDITK